MWQRFTEAARRAVFYAQEEAQRTGSGFVDPEHLFLGLTRDTDNAARQLLGEMGIDIDALRSEIALGHLASVSDPSQDMTLTPAAKQCVDLAYQEAKALREANIDTSVLLLGVFREGANLAARVLKAAGFDLEVARGLSPGVEDLKAVRAAAVSYLPVYSDASRAVLRAASEAMRDESSRQIQPRHLLLGILAEAGPEIIDALIANGTDLAKLREALKRRE